MKLTERIAELEARVTALESHPALEVPPLDRRVESARAAGKRSAAVRLAKNGTAQPQRRTTIEREARKPDGDTIPAPAPDLASSPAAAPIPGPPAAPRTPIDEALVDAARDALSSSTIGWRHSALLIDAVPRVMHAWCAPFGITFHRIADLASTDADLRAILDALACGYSVERLEAAGTRAPANARIKAEESPGPSSFTIDLLTQLIGEARA